MSNKDMNVAVIDDDSTYQFLMSRAINSLASSTHIMPFLSGIEAIKYLDENADQAHLLPDLLLLDINMPLLDGWMFLEEFEGIKSRMIKDIRIYMVSSSIDTRDVERATNNKVVVDYLMKPIPVEKLKELLMNN